MSASNGMFSPEIFQDLQARVDRDVKVREELKDITQELEKNVRVVSFALSKAHSTPVSELSSVLEAAEKPIQKVVESVGKLSASASPLPYYKFNDMWSRKMQDATYGVLLWAWLGGKNEAGDTTNGRLLTIDEVGSILNVPVNLKDEDKFHLTIEEYLQAIISLVEELSRLARNSVTLGDYARPLLISKFVKDLLAGFQVLNLKNDNLRRRSDGLKYRVKDVEDVVYDLALRNLIPKPT
ncbi:Translin [Polyplosphaeria fusca]|uniref:Translin n=1 Tax=Polyplosphaeria fusca TaxID=682080 RepID=A0A9P4QV75_9PLEO|nr:Translin [Polyplosphaeria fusca]